MQKEFQDREKYMLFIDLLEIEKIKKIRCAYVRNIFTNVFA